MEACYIADPLLNAISFRGVGLDHTWTSSDSSAGTFVPLTDPEVEFVASRKVHQSSYQDGATIFYGPSVIYLSKKDRKKVVAGKSVSVGVDHGGRRVIKKKKKKHKI